MASSSTSKRPSLYKSWFDATNAKAAKGNALGYLNSIHYMAAHTSGGAGNVCPWAARCVKPCLVSSGKGGASNVIKGRARRSQLFFSEGPEAYCNLHRAAIDGTGSRTTKHLLAVASSLGLKPALRLNGTSDIEYEKLGVLHDYPSLVKYDYTKGWNRTLDWLEGRRDSSRMGFRSNGAGAFRGLKRYHLTLSLGGKLDSMPDASRIYQEVLDRGGSIAAVWATEELFLEAARSDVSSFQISDQSGNIVQEISLGRPRKVIDGNVLNGDLRFLDPQGVIVGLYARPRTGKLDTGAKRFFLHNPGSRSRSAVVSGLPMGSMRQDGRSVSIDIDGDVA